MKPRLEAILRGRAGLGEALELAGRVAALLEEAAAKGGEPKVVAGLRGEVRRKLEEQAAAARAAQATAPTEPAAPPQGVR